MIAWLGRDRRRLKENFLSSSKDGGSHERGWTLQVFHEGPVALVRCFGIRYTGRSIRYLAQRTSHLTSCPSNPISTESTSTIPFTHTRACPNVNIRLDLGCRHRRPWAYSPYCDRSQINVASLECLTGAEAHVAKYRKWCRRVILGIPL